MNSRPFFSICIPVLNGDAYVAKAIESVLGQSFDDFELVIFNNGSTDKTREIVSSYAARSNRIRALQESTVTCDSIPAWHKVLSMGHGEYLLMLGHDDYFEKDFLKVAAEKIQVHNLDVFSSWANILDPGGQLIGIETSSGFLNKVPNVKWEEGLMLFSGKDYLTAFVKDFKGGFSKMHLSATFYRRSLYERIGGMNTTLKYCAESELYLRLAGENARFGFLTRKFLVNFIGEGPQRRAAFLPGIRRFHDFFLIPRILFERQLIDSPTHRWMVAVVTQDLIRSRGLPLLKTAKHIWRHNNGWSCLRYLSLLMPVTLYETLSGRCDRVIDKIFQYLENQASLR